MIDIRTARKEAGLTQEDLAKDLNINRATLSKYESGTISPTIEMLVKISVALNRPVTDLLGDDKPDEHGWSTNEKAVDMQDSIRENRLLIAFYGLSFEGQTKVIEYAEDLKQTGKYKRTGHTETPTSNENGKDDTTHRKQEKPPERHTSPNDGK